MWPLPLMPPPRTCEYCGDRHAYVWDEDEWVLDPHWTRNQDDSEFFCSRWCFSYGTGLAVDTTPGGYKPWHARLSAT